MNPLLPALVLAILASNTFGAGASHAPQPRPRLQPTPAGSVRVVASSPSAEPLALEKMTVESSRLPAPPRPLDEPSRDSFSVTKGGPLHRKTIGPALVEIGLWRWTDLLAEDARYKAPPTRADFEVLRVKW